MNIVLKNLNELKPYKNNPRKNENSIKYVENSIRDFGFKVPIIIDKNGEIVAGHTRYEASKNLGLEKVPCIVADDLNEEQIKAFRIADNKVADFSKWDFEKIALHDFNIKENQMHYKHDLKNSNHCYGGCCLVSDEIADKFLELKENKIEVEQETEVAQTIILSDEELEIIKELNDKKNIV